MLWFLVKNIPNTAGYVPALTLGIKNLTCIQKQTDNGHVPGRAQVELACEVNESLSSATRCNHQLANMQGPNDGHTVFAHTQAPQHELDATHACSAVTEALPLEQHWCALEALEGRMRQGYYAKARMPSFEKAHTVVMTARINLHARTWAQARTR